VELRSGDDETAGGLRGRTGHGRAEAAGGGNSGGGVSTRAVGDVGSVRSSRRVSEAVEGDDYQCVSDVLGSGGLRG